MELNGDVLAKIIGHIVLSAHVGRSLRGWRESLGISQAELARKMRIYPSVVSDYETERRATPGTGFLKRYVEALVALRSDSMARKAKTTSDDNSAILAIEEFSRPIKADVLSELIGGKVLAGRDLLDSKIYGYTVVDSIRAIYTLSGLALYRIFGSTTERALIFTKVGLGRSPLVAVRVSQLKPRMVVLHGPRVVDQLAVDLAERERIILVVSTYANEEQLLAGLAKIRT